MAESIYYDSHTVLGQSGAVSLNTSTETTVLEITDVTKLKLSQLTIYLTSVLGTNTSITYRFYYKPDNGTTYFPIVKQNISTNAIEDYAAVVSGTLLNFVLEFGLGSCFGFKITAIAAGGTTGSTATAKVLGRNN